MNQLSTFMSTFEISGGGVPLSMACNHYNLKACSLIKDKMVSAAIMTIVGSFVACIFSFELIFDLAIIHERARWRRIMNEMDDRGDFGPDKEEPNEPWCPAFANCFGGSAKEEAAEVE